MSDKLFDEFTPPPSEIGDDDLLSDEEEAVLGALGETSEDALADDLSVSEAALIEAALDEPSSGDDENEEEDLSAEEAALIEAALQDGGGGDAAAEISDDDLLGEPADDGLGDELPDIEDGLLELDAEPILDQAAETLPPPPDLKTPVPSELPGELSAGLALDDEPALALDGDSAGLNAKIETKPGGEEEEPGGSDEEVVEQPAKPSPPAPRATARAVSKSASRSATRPGTRPVGRAKQEPKPAAEPDVPDVPDEPLEDFDPYEGAPGPERLQISEERIETIDDIVSRREHTLTLITRAEEKRDQVKPDIYAKVMEDYGQQLQGIEREYEPVSQQICQEVTEISRLEVELRGERENVNDVMVEMRFRCEVGEFSEEDLFPIEAENSRKLKALNGRLSVVEGTYMVCQKYLRQEDFDAAVQRGVEAQPAVAVEEAPGEEVDIDIFDNAEEAEIIEEPVGEPIVTDPGDFSDAATPPEPMQPAEEYQAWRAEGVSEAQTMAVPAREVAGGERVRCFIILKTADGGEEPYALGLDAFAIGRHPKNDLVLSDRGISRRHARVVLEGSGQYSISDLSSGNGIFLNGERVPTKADLNNGDHIVMGNCQLCYVERLD